MPIRVNTTQRPTKVRLSTITTPALVKINGVLCFSPGRPTICEDMRTSMGGLPVVVLEYGRGYQSGLPCGYFDSWGDDTEVELIENNVKIEVVS